VSVVSARRPAVDLLVVAVTCVAVVLAFPSLSALLARQPASLRVYALLAMQFAAMGAAPAVLVAVRREPLRGYGLVVARPGASMLLGLVLAAIYLAVVSVATGTVLVVPFGRHGVLRLARALPGADGVVAPALVVAVWGVAEGLFGVYFSAKAAELACALRVRGAAIVGALAFGAFNGVLHVAVGQGPRGFAVSALSGTFVGLVPALTGNAWGGVLVQVLTNAAGPAAGP
jgi:hypothetical protein